MQILSWDEMGVVVGQGHAGTVGSSPSDHQYIPDLDRSHWTRHDLELVLRTEILTVGLHETQCLGIPTLAASADDDVLFQLFHSFLVEIRGFEDSLLVVEVEGVLRAIQHGTSDDLHSSIDDHEGELLCLLYIEDVGKHIA